MLFRCVHYSSEFLKEDVFPLTKAHTFKRESPNKDYPPKNEYGKVYSLSKYPLTASSFLLTSTIGGIPREGVGVKNLWVVSKKYIIFLKALYGHINFSKYNTKKEYNLLQTRITLKKRTQKARNSPRKNATTILKYYKCQEWLIEKDGTI